MFAQETATESDSQIEESVSSDTEETVCVIFEMF